MHAEDYQDQRGEASVQVLKVGSKFERTPSTCGLIQGISLTLLYADQEQDFLRDCGTNVKLRTPVERRSLAYNSAAWDALLPRNRMIGIRTEKFDSLQVLKSRGSSGVPLVWPCVQT